MNRILGHVQYPQRPAKSKPAAKKVCNNGCTPWTGDEDSTLCRLYPTHMAKDIAMIMGRTLRSVKTRAQLLELKKRVLKAA